MKNKYEVALGLFFGVASIMCIAMAIAWTNDSGVGLAAKYSGYYFIGALVCFTLTVLFLKDNMD